MTLRKKLSFVTPNFGREHGGVGASAHRIVGHLRLVFDITVFVPDKSVSSGTTTSEKSLGLEIVRFGLCTDPKTTGQFCSDLLIREHRAVPSSVLCGFYLSVLSYSVVLTAKLLALPSIVFARGNDIDLEIFGMDAHAIQYSLENAHTVMCVSTEMEQKIRAWSPHSNTLWIPNGVDEVEFPLMEPCLADKEIVIGLFGEIKAKKGLGLLLEAIDFETCTLQITGRLDNESSTLLHGFLTLYPALKDKIRVTPYLKRHVDLLDAYRSVHIVCIPSLHDGMPNVLLEALSCGKIVVASDVGGATDIIRHGENGFLCARGDVATLRAALVQAQYALKDPEQRIGQTARKTIIENFNWQLEMSNYRNFFQNLLASDQALQKAV